MRQIQNLPTGIEIFTDFMSISEAEYIIDAVESAVEKDCGAKWTMPPSSHSPDISCFRNNFGINISEHGFKNSSCSCGLKEIDAILGTTMLKSLAIYNKKYSLTLTQDEGFVISKQAESHVDQIVIDENPFVNRVISYNIALNVEDPIEYMRFEHFDLDITLSQPSIVVYPSNFIYAYSKPKNEDLYEVLNYFNNNPQAEVFDQVFGEVQES